LSLISLICFIPALVGHEYAHGWVAHKLGDPTAKQAGRLTLNPLAHVDIFGTVILPIAMMLVGGPVFGYAKPVPYNPGYFKDRKRGEVMVGFAGPVANLLMALASAVVGNVLAFAYHIMPAGTAATAVLWAVYVLYIFTQVNLVLLFFNIIPIPPLDGSSIIAPLLSQKALEKYYVVERYALPILLVVLIVLPYILHVDPIGAYLNATAGNLSKMLYPGL
jgi:Zn-dependent protease